MGDGFHPDSELQIQTRRLTPQGFLYPWVKPDPQRVIGVCRLGFIPTICKFGVEYRVGCKGFLIEV